MITRIISGGQTGVDRAGLDAALELGIPIGGWCPRGRRAEDGQVPEQYTLDETSSADYMPRTRLNVEQADATLIVTHGPISGGTSLTRAYCRSQGQRHLVIDLAASEFGHCVQVARAWLIGLPGWDLGVDVNVAGPRESKVPGIHDMAKRFLLDVIRGLGEVKS